MSQVVARWQYHTTSASELSLTCLCLFAGGEYFRFSKITQFPLLKYHPPARVVSLHVGKTAASLISLYFPFSNITHLPASLSRGGGVYFRFSNITQHPLLYYHPPACGPLQGGSVLPPSTTIVAFAFLKWHHSYRVLHLDQTNMMLHSRDSSLLGEDKRRHSNTCCLAWSYTGHICFYKM